MTQSIIYDKDLKYEIKDLDRVRKDPFRDVPAGLYLTPTRNGYTYGKPFLYSLFSAPFYIILRERGFILFNFILFSLIIWLGYLYLKQKNDSPPAFLFSLLFFFLSSSFVYVFCIHPEIFTMFLMMLALFLWFHPKPKFYTASLIFALLAISKPPTLIFFAAFILWTIQNKIPGKKILNSILIFFCLFCIFTLCNYFFAKNPFFYFKIRHYYPAISSVPFYNGISDISGRVEAVVPFQSQSLLHFDFKMVILFALTINYFILGRFTGILLYYPTILSGLYLYDKKDRKKSILLAASLLYSLSLVVIWHKNYFGGGDVIGNRYFFIILPAFFFIIGKIRFDFIVKTVFIISLIFTIPFIVMPNLNSMNTFTHILLPQYQFFPLEKTALSSLPFVGKTFKLRMSPFFIDNFEGRGKQSYKDQTTGDMIYFLNGQHYLRENGFYVASGDRCQLAIKTNNINKQYISFPAKNNSDKKALVIIQVADKEKSAPLFPGDSANITFSISSLKRSWADIDEPTSAVFQIDIKVIQSDSPDQSLQYFKDAPQKEMVFFGWPQYS